MNLSDNSDGGMVQVNSSTSFITHNNEEKNDEIFLEYSPFRKKRYTKIKKSSKEDDNPFKILSNVNFN